MSGREWFIPSPAKQVDQHSTVAEPFHDDTFSPGAGLLRRCTHIGSRAEQWWSGDFVDYRGIVTVQMEDTYLRLDTVQLGRCHVRSWGRGFGDRTVAKLCRAFLTDLHGAPCAVGTAETPALPIHQQDDRNVE